MQLKQMSFSLAFLMLGGASAAHATTYNALADYSAASNPAGVWAYGEGTAGTSFTPFVNHFTIPSFDIWQSSTPSLGAPAVIKNTSATTQASGTAIFPANVLDFHPGPNSDVIIQFTAPDSGLYTYNGLYEILDYVAPKGILAEIYLNSTLVLSQFVGGTSANLSTLQPGSSMTFGGAVTMTAGDKLSFAANRAGEFTFDSTGFNVTITHDSVNTVPLPAALPLLVMGLAGLGAASRKQRRT